MFFQIIVNNKNQLNRMNYLLMAMSSPIEMISNIRHLEN